MWIFSRLQRTPIKLQCFAVESVTKKKESVGYLILDLRSVQEGRQVILFSPLFLGKKSNFHSDDGGSRK